MTGVVAAVWREKKLWAIHLIANAALLVVIYQWLRIPDRTVLHLLASGVSALGIVVVALWLHGGTLAHFRDAHAQQSQKLAATFRAQAGRLPAFAVWAAVFVVLVVLVLQLHGYREQAANWTSSWLTLRLRRPVTPAAMSSVFWWAITLMAGAVVPVLLLPWGLLTARYGFQGFAWSNLKASCRTARRLRYWLSYGVFFVAGVVIPYQLAWWIPGVEGFYLETASLIVRLGVAYVIAVTCWMLLASAVGWWVAAEKA